VTRSRLPDVETLACAVAGRYAARWARSVARMQTRDDAADAPGPWLVDAFAGADLQRAAIRGTPIQPPAAAFARAAQEAFGGAARVVLVEEDPGLLTRLESELGSAGFHPRHTADPAGAAPGEIVLVEAPFASVASRLAGEIADAPALLRLAPLSARALPWPTLELLADLSGADLLLRFPREDFARAGKFGGPLADFPPHLRRVAEGCSSFFADERHGWLLAWREAARAGGDEAALTGTVERLRAMLGGGERVARAARLEGAGGAAVHVLLSSPHPEHALELNGAITDGGAPAPAPPQSAKSAGRKSAAAPAPPQPPEAAPAASAAPAPDAASEAPPPPRMEAEPDAREEPKIRAEASAPVAPDARTEHAAPHPDAEPDAREEAEVREEPSVAIEPAARTGPASPVEPDTRAAPALRAEPPAPEAPALLDLFALEATPLEPELPRGPDLRAVADDLHARHAGRRVPFRELLGDLADAGLAPEQVRTALGILKRHRRATYGSLDVEGAEVEFLAEPAAPPPPPAPKPRKPRKPVPGVLGLFDEPEAEDEPPPMTLSDGPRVLDPVDDSHPMTLADAIGALDPVDEPPPMTLSDAVGALDPTDEPPPMTLSDAIGALDPTDEPPPMTRSDAIGALESEAAEAPDAGGSDSAPPAEPAKKPRRRRAE
jgi:hypothetical protein